MTRQVGLYLEGVTVQGTVLGGPAWASEYFAAGDIIVAVDNQAVNEETVQYALRNTEAPESTVTITVRKGGKQVVASLIFTLSWKACPIDFESLSSCGS